MSFAAILVEKCPNIHGDPFFAKTLRKTLSQRRLYGFVLKQQVMEQMIMT
jgi:hypothetical protein